MARLDSDALGPLLHGAARAWRLKLDARLKPMGLSQAKWRTLLHLSRAERVLTQAEIAALLGIEEPSLVTLLHRLEDAGWVRRENSPQDRRCKTVHLERRAHRVIDRINSTALRLRHELIADIPRRDLQTCMRVLTHVWGKADAAENSLNGRRASNGNK